MKEENFIDFLEDFGFSHYQALIYFALVKMGEKGSIVKDLDHSLEVGRTNIYPILHELIDIGGVIEGGLAEKSKNAKIFIANDPSKFLDSLIARKREELDYLIKKKIEYEGPLEEIYHKGFKIALDKIDGMILAYLKPLINDGWKINSYTEREESTIFNYKVFDCMLRNNEAHLLKDCSFHLFVFDYNIEDDKDALNVFAKGLKRRTKEGKSYFYDIKQFHLDDDQILLHGKKYPCFIMKVKGKDLKYSAYFSEFPQEIDSQTYIEIGKAVIIAIQEKLFFLWAESDEMLAQMVAPIFKTHHIK